MNFIIDFFNGNITEINLREQKIKHFILLNYDEETYLKIKSISDDILKDLDK